MTGERTPGPRRTRPGVLIAGAGVAGLEAILAIRHLAEDRVDIDLLTPDDYFTYRPLAVAEPFGLGRPHRFDLDRLIRDWGVRRNRGWLASVERDRGIARTGDGRALPYDALLVTSGARTLESLGGALTFRGPADFAAFRKLLDEVEAGAVRSVAFALPGGAVWSLPLYELALLTASWLAERRVSGARLTLVTHEQAPLALFGTAASKRVRDLLEQRGIGLVTGSYPAVSSGGTLALIPSGRAVEAERVVTLPRLEGPRLPGLPHDAEGFIPTDLYGRVRGVGGAYAAGDVTAFPVKQGGLAAQQADAAARTIAAWAGAPVELEPFRPVLRGLLLTGGEPSFMRAEISGGRGETSATSTRALWWPPGKIAGRYLAPYLASRVGLSKPAVPPGGTNGAIAVEVALPRSASSA